jgi:Spy/CpxP family protein refolding chaperone
MKKLFLFAVAGFFFAINTNAQVSRKTNRAQKIQSDSSRHQRGEMMDQLNLTPDQKSQIKSLHESNKQERDAIKNDASLTQEQKRAKMKDLQKSQSQKMNGILTPDQQAKRKAFMEKRRSEGKMHHKKSNGTNPTPVQ